MYPVTLRGYSLREYGFGVGVGDRLRGDGGGGGGVLVGRCKQWWDTTILKMIIKMYVYVI